MYENIAHPTYVDQPLLVCKQWGLKSMAYDLENNEGVMAKMGKYGHGGIYLGSGKIRSTYLLGAKL